MTNREAFVRANRLAVHDIHLARIIRPYVDRYGAAGMRRILDDATADMLLADLGFPGRVEHSTMELES